MRYWPEAVQVPVILALRRIRGEVCGTVLGSGVARSSRGLPKQVLRVARRFGLDRRWVPYLVIVWHPVEPRHAPQPSLSRPPAKMAIRSASSNPYRLAETDRDLRDRIAIRRVNLADAGPLTLQGAPDLPNAVHAVLLSVDALDAPYAHRIGRRRRGPCPDLGCEARARRDRQFMNPEDTADRPDPRTNSNTYR